LKATGGGIYNGTGEVVEGSVVLSAAWLKKPMLCLIDLKTGVMCDACVFLTVLGVSNIPYMKAFPRKEQQYWMRGLINAIEYYGGLPAFIAPRTANMPKIPEYLSPSNDSAFGMLSKFYNIPVLSVNSKHPSLSPDIDEFGPVSWFLRHLRDKVFYSLEELNDHISLLLSRYMILPFSKSGNSPFNIFCIKDKPLLRPLPEKRFSIIDISTRVVGDNCFIQYDGHYYSVPYKFCKQKVILHISESEIVIYDTNGVWLAAHKRDRKSKYVTDPTHMPPKYKLFGAQVYDGGKYVDWASHIGDNTRFVIEYLLATADYEQQAFKTCMAILQLSVKYGNCRLESACKTAKLLGYINYYSIKKFVLQGPIDSMALSGKTTICNEYLQLRLDTGINF